MPNFEFTPALLGICYLLAVAWPLAKTDLKEHRLPNKLVVPSYAFTLVGQLGAILFGSPAGQMLQAFLLALLVFSLALAVNFCGNLGMGDVKLLAAIAFSLGWFGGELVLIAITAGFAVGALSVIAKRLITRTTWRTAIALGPQLLLGFGFGAAALVF